MEKIYVFGHKNPDTDSVLSSIVYSKYLDLKNIENEAIVLGELNQETKFILKKFDVGEPKFENNLAEESKIVLMDHNEFDQSIDNIENLNIVEIIDHHKFKVHTSNPIKIRTEPIGSTCSIVAKIFFENNVELNKVDAELLISGIISDTLYFRSPTTTTEDKEICKKLNKIAKISDLEEYSLEMFNAKSDLGNIDVEKLIKLDYKIFEFGGSNYGVGVMETTNPNYGLNRKDEIIEKMKEIKHEDNLKGIFLSIVDILNEKNTTIFSDEEDGQLLKNLFNAKINGNLADLGNVVSRKKQIVPVFEKKLN